MGVRMESTMKAAEDADMVPKGTRKVAPRRVGPKMARAGKEEPMLVEERVVDEIVRGLDEPTQIVDEASDVSWFAARQPGIGRSLAARCGEDSDATAVALHDDCA